MSLLHMKIYPSILQPDVNSLFYQLENLKQKYDYFQIDIADGKLVSNTTVSILDIKKHLNLLHSKFSSTSQYAISCEFHLMVENYEQAMIDLTEIANYWIIKKVVIHLKAIHRGITAYDIRNPLSETSLGIALNPDEKIENNYTTIQTFPYVLIMSVHPGKQGNPFIFDTLHKIKRLKERGYPGQIGLDGGINEKTLPLIQQYPVLPDFVFPGSWLAVK